MAMKRVMEVVTPLGDDLLFQRLHAREELSRLSEFELDLLSPKRDINLDEVLGKTFTVKLALPNDKSRYFNGYVTRFAQIGMQGRYHSYRATLRPWLWFLTRTADCRIFQEQTVPDIIKTVFADHSAADFKNDLTGTYRKWNYCVQYRETDFNFVSRLMEQEGIYYYFTHAEGRHTLVLADSHGKHSPFPGYEQIHFVTSDKLKEPEQDHISEWNFSREIQPVVYAVEDYDFERPSVDLATKQKVTNRKHDHADSEVYDYPGEYIQKADGDQYAQARLDELQTQFELAHGTCNARGLCAGRLFKLVGQPRDDQNREYLVLAATHQLQFSEYEAMEAGGASYSCSFSVLSTKQQYRPQRLTPKPVVQGPQTAVVVGPDGDEIYTDKYGRVKVQFHWDRYGKKNENSSCWVRVSHPWAGKNWGLVAIPRIGQEVIVDFLEGDPDEPIITGRVYNADQMPPYDLPANMTQTGIKSRSSKDGTGANFNEIRFEDKKGSEQLYIHAERNMDAIVENDETRDVGHDRTTHVKNDEMLNVDVNRTTHVKGNFKETVDGTETRTVTGSVTEKVNGGETRTINAGATETINAGETRTVNGGLKETINGGETRTVTGGLTETITGSFSQTASGGITINTSGSMTLIATGGYTLVAPGGTKIVDFQLSQLGGALFETYGQKVKSTPINMEVNAFKAETHGIKVDMGAVFNKQAGVQMKKLGAKLLSCDSAVLEQAGVRLAKAGAFLIG
ncbi:MAG TPA: type VI secretion system tip protein TssI/VgrG [Burkholderiales bacterium]|nr:type VI secretion system tip protein TssI/VgrG [Burkholderiales bacterium]